jgi:hypothetical protein
MFRMNCNDFELKITDLARHHLSEAGARERAIAHAAECRRCAARLRDEQRLTAGLRELAATFAGEQMSARGEAQLLAAFRAEHRAPLSHMGCRRRHRYPGRGCRRALHCIERLANDGRRLSHATTRAGLVYSRPNA